MIDRFDQIREEIHYVQNGLYYIDNIPGAVRAVAEALRKPPTLWQRLRNWWILHRWRKAIPQKQWAEKSREALTEWETRAAGNGTPGPADPEAWRSVWR